MLQSIQYIGSGPPTYVYSNKETGASDEFYHVFATETRGYSGNKQKKNNPFDWLKREMKAEAVEPEEAKANNHKPSGNVQEMYQKEYGRRESFLWKQR